MRNVRVTPIAPVARKQHICRERVMDAVRTAANMGAVDVGLVLVYPCGGVGTMWASEGDVHALLGGTAVLQHRITTKIASCALDAGASVRADLSYTPPAPDAENSPEGIARFLSFAFSPHGVYGAGCWKCGQMAMLASELLRAAGFKDVGVDMQVVEGVMHMWATADEWWVDPAIGQFNPQLPPFGRLPHPLAPEEENT